MTTQEPKELNDFSQAQKDAAIAQLTQVIDQLGKQLMTGAPQQAGGQAARIDQLAWMLQALNVLTSQTVGACHYLINGVKRCCMLNKDQCAAIPGSVFDGPGTTCPAAELTPPTPWSTVTQTTL